MGAKGVKYKHTQADKEDIFFALAHNSPQPMLIANERVEIRYVNPAWEKQFGYTLDEVRGKNPRILQSGQTPPEVHARMWQALKAGKTFQTTEVIDKRKDGTFFNLRSTVFPVHTTSSLHYVQMLDDITEEKRAAEFQKLFLKTAAHDIRTPLQSLRLISEIALLNGESAAMRDIQAQIRRADQLTTSLLDSKRFESGKIVVQPRNFDLAELVRDVVNTKHAHPGIVTCTASGPVMVTADLERITQVLVNLIENALKYGGVHEAVLVSIKSEKDRAIVAVADKGCGISREDQVRLFDPYFRTEAARASSTEGSGLGLHIAREILRAHGRNLWVESKIDDGSTFFFDVTLVA